MHIVVLASKKYIIFNMSPIYLTQLKKKKKKQFSITFLNIHLK